MPIDRDNPQFWRSLEDLHDPSVSTQWRASEFPQAFSGISRRDLFKLTVGAMAAAALPGCGRQPPEAIVPYLQRPPEYRDDGEVLYYATTLSTMGYGRGVLVESFDGRPIKVEGNPQHPASRGATNHFDQAVIYDLYDPTRSKMPLKSDMPTSSKTVLAELRNQVSACEKNNGEGMHVLTSTITSPTIHQQLDQLNQRCPQMHWYVHEPVDELNMIEGCRLAFGRSLLPIYHGTNARIILTVDCDALMMEPDSVRFAREFADYRRRGIVEDGRENMNRLYCVEPSPTVTGAKADHRLSMRRGDIEQFVAHLEAVLLRQAEPSDPFMADVVADFRQAMDHAMVIPGRTQPPAVHAACHRINHQLGAIHNTVDFITPPSRSHEAEDIHELSQQLAAGRVQTLVIVDVNPAFTSPPDLDLNRRLQQSNAFTLHVGSRVDETARSCTFHLPMAHPLETWGDARAPDGTASLMQPLINPLYDGLTITQILAAALGDLLAQPFDLPHDQWLAHSGQSETMFAETWRNMLLQGVIPGTTPSPEKTLLPKSQPAKWNHKATDRQGIELALDPDYAVWDGRFATNAWLEELPRPLSKLTWDNALLVSPTTAEELGLNDGEIVQVDAGSTLAAPVLIQPGQADGTVSLSLGYGRQVLGSKVGVNAYPLRRGQQWYQAVTLHKTGRHHRFALTQHHGEMEGRGHYRLGTIDEYRNDPEKIAEHPEPQSTTDIPLTLLPDQPPYSPQWGMSIDLTACIGCGACTIACQAENNIPVVGQEEVSRGREMHWIRIDRLFSSKPVAPAIHHQPVPCMHCENAPCELVCPVGATQHSDDGLNEMVYNRCVGTRYCSNNCPYKVRRFNFLNYTANISDTEALRQNPQVTVRSRGVMEKCTYCVQRIRRAEIVAQREHRDLVDGEIVTACQAVCPTRAIIFGDITDPESSVSKAKASDLDYGMLTELNTRPRTTYLAKITNPRNSENPTSQETPT